MIGLPNPWVIVGALLLVAGAFFYGSHVGATGEKAKYATTQLLIAKAVEGAQQAAASEIAKITIVNKTIQQKLETVTRENTVYRDCVNTPDALRLLNDALSGQPGTEPSAGFKLPESSPAH